MSKVVLISFYDRISLSNRTLSSSLKKNDHDVSLIFLKDDRTVVLNQINPKAEQYQILSLNKFIGCGMDVDPITTIEWNLLDSLLQELNPDVVGVSARSMHLDLSLKVARKVRFFNDSILLIAGGYGPTIDPESFLEEFDYVCLGEGELAFPALLDEKNLTNNRNFAFKENGILKYNGFHKPVDLDYQHWPDWEHEEKYMIADNQIKYGSSFYNSQVYDILASRGCISTCTYCMACQWSKILSRYGTKYPKYRHRSPESVIEELKSAKQKFNLSYVRFKDSIFGINKNWLFKFMDMYDSHINLPFHCLLDERYATYDIIERLSKSGLKYTTVGIQSADPTIRREIFGRNISNQGIVDYINNLYNNNIEIKYDLIGWNPFEGEQQLKNCLDFLSTLPKADQVVTFELKMFPGTPILEKYKNSNLKSLSRERYTFYAILFNMMLYSSETEKKAFDLLKKNTTPQEALDKFTTCIYNKQSYYVIKANTDLQRNQILTNASITFDTCSSEQTIKKTIPYYEKEFILNSVLNKDIEIGTFLTWDDIYSTYESIGSKNLSNQIEN